MGSEHKWGVGYGAAANKLSRLASTDWVEAFTKATNARVHLHGSIAKTANRDQDSDIKFWSDQIKELKVATLLSGPDLAYALQSVAIGQKMQVQVPMMQGYGLFDFKTLPVAYTLGTTDSVYARLYTGSTSWRWARF